MSIKIESLIEMLTTLSKIMIDVDFIKQALAINDDITILSRDN